MCEFVVLGVLIRGLENLDVLCKENGFILFACTKRTKSTPKGCDPLDSGERFKALSEILLENFPAARVEPGFSHKTVSKRL